MKRPPNSGEPALVHKTTNTGDEQSFAICDENFNPGIVKRMREMLQKPLMGYRLEVISDQWFYVVRDFDGARLTQNFLRRRDNGDIALDTTLQLSDDMTPQEAYMLADLEQCAALMLVESSLTGTEGKP